MAGIGKTRLLTHACDQAARAGMTVLAARAAEFEDGYAWGVVGQLFEAEIRADGGQRRADDAMALAALALTRDVPRGDEDSFAVLHGLYWLTADIAHQAPLLLAVDDLHWADQPSQRFVAHLAHRLEGLAVLLVLTVREPRSGTAQQKSLIAGLATEASVIALRPAALGAAACAELVRGTLGVDPSPAFQGACRELTGGNPLLLRGLLASLAAEGAKGTDAEVPHLRRLTPGSVSRSVLLQLGRMPAAALAAARAVAVLGTAATAGRAGRLAGLDGDASAEAIGALMAERFIEGERALRFVHPLVRSAVYQDLAPPVRQRWHKRAARMLDEEDAASAEVTVHLLAAAATGDAWVVDRLRRAAADARRRGAPDVAVQCLERALAEPPAAGARGDVLFELGSAQTFHAPAAAAEHLTEALARSAGWPRRGEIALALSQALGLCGRFADAVEVLQAAIGESGEDRSPIAISLQSAVLNVARWDLDTRPVMRPILERLQAKADAGEDLDPQVHANLAIELGAAGLDRELAIRHARAAVRATPRLMSLTSTALPEAVTVLLFGGMSREAADGAQTWLRLARQRGWPLASALAATAASLVALYDGEVGQALAYGQQAMTGGGWISTMATAFMIPALIDRDAIDEARALLAAGNLDGPLGLTWPYNVARHARGRLHAAAGDHAAAVRDLLKAGELAELWGVRNPTLMPWRSDAALSLTALGDGPRGQSAVRGGNRTRAAVGRPPGSRDRSARRRSRRGRGYRVAHRGRERAAPFAGPAGAGSCPDRSRRGATAGRLARPGARSPARRPGPSPRNGGSRPRRAGPAGARCGRGQAPPRCHAGTRRADAKRTAGGAASGGRTDEPADRTGPVRHPADRGKSPDQYLRQTRDQLPARAAGRAGWRPPGRPRLGWAQMLC